MYTGPRPIKRLHYITGQINTPRPQHRRGLLSVKRGVIERGEMQRYTNESRWIPIFPEVEGIIGERLEKTTRFPGDLNVGAW